MQANDKFLKNTYNRYLIPTMLSVLGGTINVFFDGIIIGQKLGSDGLAALNLCMPIFLTLCTFGSLIASGACLISSREIGKSNEEESQKNFHLSIIMMVLSATVIMILGLLLINPLTTFLSQGSDTYDLVKPYAVITLFGSLPNMLLYIPFYYLRLEGKNRQISYVMLAMTGLNILMDLLFMFAFDWGIGGAALASVFSTLIACILGFASLCKQDSNFKIKIVAINFREILSIIKYGSPAALNNLFFVLRVLMINTILFAFGGNLNVSIFAVINSLSEFSLFIINGIPQTASPIIGIYSAEKSNGGIRILMKRQLHTGLLLISVFGLIIALMANQIGLLFGVTGKFIVPIACLAISLILAQINSIMTYYFSSTGWITLANLITSGRILVFAVGFTLSLSILGDNVWLFLPLSELATLILWLTAVMIIKRMNQNLSGILLLDDTLERNETVIDFSIRANNTDICNASERITEFCEKNDMSPKQIMKISLAIEEILLVMAKKCFGGDRDGDHSMDVRAFHISGTIGIRIRCGGVKFNPLSHAEADEDEYGDMMGIKMISKMSDVVKYQCTFGVNSVLILI